MRKVRVRFAPSPTGPLHIGGVRTALYNYLFARQNGGDMILRIEDTDQTRFVPGAEDYIIEALDWLGIKFDEGVHIGGNYGPYRQSDRKPMYRQYADQLIRDGWAYYAFDKPEALDAKRKEYEAQKKTFQYDCNTRGNMENSLSLPADDVQRRLDSGELYVVRFKFPENIDITVHDLIRGDVTMNSHLLDDKVLFKSDGMPTYHLANIVDDHLMEVSHVIRGEEWLPSAPLHVMLYKAFGWDDTMPQFAHLPLLLKPEGNGKLSKRDGDRLGFPVFPLEWHDPKTGEISSGYREKDYLPEAVINFLALLGWNPGDDREIMTMDEMVSLFNLEKCSKAGARFNYQKLVWFNHEYIMLKSDREVAGLFAPVLESHGIKAPIERIEKAVGLVKNRVNFVGELWDNCKYLFEAPSEYDEKSLRKWWKDNAPQTTAELCDFLESQPVWDGEVLEPLVMEWISSKGYQTGKVMNALRVTLVGAAMGPQIFCITDFIGREETLRRARKAISELS